MSSNDDNNSTNHQSVLLEEINDNLKAILKSQILLANVPADLAQLKKDMTEVKADLHIIKAVVTEHSTDLDDHEIRIKHLETAAHS